MSAPIRVLDSGPMSARHNIAVTAALAELHRAGKIPDTVRFARYPRAVLLGADDSFAGAYRVKACVADSVEIVRRTSGDRTIYVSPGVLAWSVVAECYRFGARLAEIGEQVCSAVAAGLARFGLPAGFRPRDDVAIDGRSVCAANGAIEGTTVVFEGAVLIDLDAAELEAVARLAGTGEDDTDRPVPAARVTTISAFLGRVPSDSEIKGLLVAGLSHCWRCELVPDALTPAEMALADRLFDAGVGRPRLASQAPHGRAGRPGTAPGTPAP